MASLAISSLPFPVKTMNGRSGVPSRTASSSSRPFVSGIS